MSRANKGKLITYEGNEHGEYEIKFLDVLLEPFSLYLRDNYKRAIAFIDVIKKLQCLNQANDTNRRTRMATNTYKALYHKPDSIEGIYEKNKFEEMLLNLVNLVQDCNIKSYNSELREAEPNTQLISNGEVFWGLIRGKIFEDFTIRVYADRYESIKRGRNIYVLSTNPRNHYMVTSSSQFADIKHKKSIDFLVEDEGSKLIGECKIGPSFIDKSIVSLLTNIESAMKEVSDIHKIAIFSYSDREAMESLLENALGELRITDSRIQLVDEKMYKVNNIDLGMAV